MHKWCVLTSIIWRGLKFLHALLNYFIFSRSLADRAGLCWKRKTTFCSVAWEVSGIKNLKRLRKSPVKTERGHRELQILLLFCAFAKLERPKTRQFFCLLEIFGCWDGTGFAGSKWSAWFNLHCTGGLTETPPSSSNIQQPSGLFFAPGRFCFGICFTIFTIDSG